MRSTVIWGWALILAGVILALGSAGLLPGYFQLLQPVLLPILVIAFGIFLLWRSASRRRSPMVGILILAVGIFWLGNRVGLVGESFLLPLVLMALGLGLLLRPTFRARV